MLPNGIGDCMQTRSIEGIPELTRDAHLRVPMWVDEASKAQGLTIAQYVLRACRRFHEGKLTPPEAKEAIIRVTEVSDVERLQPIALLSKIASVRKYVHQMMVD